ncbi:MAG TPA: hypothetical protein VIK28_05330 [Sedimentisphaerales bacterium]
MNDYFESIKLGFSAPFVPVLAALIAFVPAIVAAFVSLLISRRSIYINSVTVERSKWIGELRSNIASLSGLVLDINQKLIFVEGYELSEPYHQSAQEIHRLTSLIKLQLNPFNEIDKNIIRILDNFEQSFQNPRTSRWAGDDYLLVAHAQWLLKAEWEKVKLEAAGCPKKLSLWLKAKIHMRRYRKFANSPAGSISSD